MSLQPPNQQLHQKNCDVSPFSHLHALPNRNVEKKDPQSQWSPELLFRWSLEMGKVTRNGTPGAPAVSKVRSAATDQINFPQDRLGLGAKKFWAWFRIWQKSWFVVFCFVWASFRYIVRLLPEILADSHWFIWSLSIPIVCHSEVLFLQRHGSGAPTGNGCSYGGSNATVHLLGVNIFTQSSWLFFIHAPVISYFLTYTKLLSHKWESHQGLISSKFAKNFEALNLIGLCWMISPHAGSLNFNDFGVPPPVPSRS